MTNVQFPFDYQKGTQVLNFFAKKQGGKINKMKAIKLIFLADRYHVRKYGRLITNDAYVAMKHGPVPSTTRDLLESSDYLADEAKTYSQRYIEAVNGREYVSIADVDSLVFSESDLEALEYVWSAFGRYDQFQLRDITHSYPEWTKHRKQVENGSCAPMNLLDFLKNPTEKVDPALGLNEVAHRTFDLSPEGQQVRDEQLRESSQIEALWR